jgi:hypothetical protein
MSGRFRPEEVESKAKSVRLSGPAVSRVELSLIKSEDVEAGLVRPTKVRITQRFSTAPGHDE